MIHAVMAEFPAFTKFLDALLFKGRTDRRGIWQCTFPLLALTNRPPKLFCAPSKIQTKTNFIARY